MARGILTAPCPHPYAQALYGGLREAYPAPRKRSGLTLVDTVEETASKPSWCAARVGAVVLVLLCWCCCVRSLCLCRCAVGSAPVIAARRANAGGCTCSWHVGRGGNASMLACLKITKMLHMHVCMHALRVSNRPAPSTAAGGQIVQTVRPQKQQNNRACQITTAQACTHARARARQAEPRQRAACSPCSVEQLLLAATSGAAGAVARRRLQAPDDARGVAGHHCVWLHVFCHN